MFPAQSFQRRSVAISGYYFRGDLEDTDNYSSSLNSKSSASNSSENLRHKSATSSVRHVEDANKPRSLRSSIRNSFHRRSSVYSSGIGGSGNQHPAGGLSEPQYLGQQYNGSTRSGSFHTGIGGVGNIVRSESRTETADGFERMSIAMSETKQSFKHFLNLAVGIKSG